MTSPFLETFFVCIYIQEKKNACYLKDIAENFFVNLLKLADDRPSFAALHGILFGPYLLAGLSNGDWDIRRKPTSPPRDWITPIPPSYNSYLITLCQHSGNHTFALENSNTSVITIGKLPEPGSNSSVHATFRLVLTDPKPPNFSKPRDAIGKQVMLEPFDLPGMVVVHKGKDQSRLKVEDSSTTGGGRSVFRLIPGLNGKDDTVSLESESLLGCFVASHRRAKSSGGSIRLRCKNGWSSIGGVDSGSGFKEATSFLLKDGVSRYHPMSFLAKGGTRNFVLQPLLSLRDEYYTVYFNIQP